MDAKVLMRITKYLARTSPWQIYILYSKNFWSLPQYVPFQKFKLGSEQVQVDDKHTVFVPYLHGFVAEHASPNVTSFSIFITHLNIIKI